MSSQIHTALSSLNLGLQSTSESLAKKNQSAANTKYPLEDFLFFPNLPAEIRLKVWHLVLHTHRTITLKQLKTGVPTYSAPIRNEEIITVNKETSVVEKDDAPAVLLSVNHEARAEALSFYDGIIPSRDIAGRKGVGEAKETKGISGSGQKIPISWANTTFHITTRHLRDLCDFLMRKIQHLKIDVNDAPYFVHFALETLKSMSSLRVLTLNVKRIEPNSWSPEREWWMAIAADMENEKLSDLEWDFPLVKILDADTGKELVEIKARKGVPENPAEKQENK